MENTKKLMGKLDDKKRLIENWRIRKKFMDVVNVNKRRKDKKNKINGIKMMKN